MTVRKRNLKKIKSKELSKKAIRIKCEHCIFNEKCKNRLKHIKLKSEEMGINAYCTFAKKKMKPKKNSFNTFAKKKVSKDA